MTSTSDEDLLRRLLDAMASLPNEDEVYLDGLGWFRILRFPAYEGRNPRTGQPVRVPAKTTVLFEADGSLLNALNGMLAEDFGDPTQPMRDNVIHRYEWAEPLASRLRHELIAQGSAEIVDLGTLRVERRTVVDDAGRPRPTGESRLFVFWKMSEAGRRSLDPATRPILSS